MVRGGYLVEEASRSVTSTLVYQRSHGRLYCIVPVRHLPMYVMCTRAIANSHLQSSCQ